MKPRDDSQRARGTDPEDTEHDRVFGSVTAVHISLRSVAKKFRGECERSARERPAFLIPVGGRQDEVAAGFVEAGAVDAVIGVGEVFEGGGEGEGCGGAPAGAEFSDSITGCTGGGDTLSVDAVAGGEAVLACGGGRGEFKPSAGGGRVPTERDVAGERHHA